MAERKPSEIEAPSKAEMAERMRLASLDGSETAKPASKPVSTASVEEAPERVSPRTTTPAPSASTPTSKR